MNKHNVTIPCSGFKVGFENIHAAMDAALSFTGVAMAVVDAGTILRIDAVKGESLPAGLRLGELGELVNVDGFYGTLEALGLYVGPFNRKSEAMNAIVLTLMGEDVIPNMEAPVEVLAYDLEADLVGKGVPETVAAYLAANIRGRYGDAVTAGKVILDPASPEAFGAVEVVKPTIN